MSFSTRLHSNSKEKLSHNIYLLRPGFNFTREKKKIRKYDLPSFLSSFSVFPSAATRKEWKYIKSKTTQNFLSNSMKFPKIKNLPYQIHILLKLSFNAS